MTAKLLLMTTHGDPLRFTIKKLCQAALVFIDIYFCSSYPDTPEFYNETKWYIGPRTSLTETFTIISHNWDHRLTGNTIIYNVWVSHMCV